MSVRGYDRGRRAAEYLRAVSGHPAIRFDKVEGHVSVPGMAPLVLRSDRKREEPLRLAKHGETVLYVGGIRDSVVTDRYYPKNVTEYVVCLGFGEYADLLHYKVDAEVLSRLKERE